MLWLAFVDSDLIEHSKIFAFPTPPPPAVHQLNFSQENRWNAIKCIIYRRSSVSLLVWCSNFSISGRNVLFRCCFRFFPTFKAKHGAKREFSVTRVFLLFWRFLFSYFTLLLSTCCLRMIRCWKILLPFFWWVSSSLPLFRRFKKCQNPSFLLCLAFDFFQSEFLSGFADISLCDIIKKSELWFIE